MTDEKKPTEIFINGVRVGVIRSFTPRPVPVPVHELKAVDYTPTGQVDSFNLEFTRTIDLSQQHEPETLRDLFERLGTEPPEELKHVLDSPYWVSGVSHGNTDGVIVKECDLEFATRKIVDSAGDS